MTLLKSIPPLGWGFFCRSQYVNLTHGHTCFTNYPCLVFLAPCSKKPATVVDFTMCKFYELHAAACWSPQCLSAAKGSTLTGPSSLAWTSQARRRQCIASCKGRKRPSGSRRITSPANSSRPLGSRTARPMSSCHLEVSEAEPPASWTTKLRCACRDPHAPGLTRPIKRMQWVQDALGIQPPTESRLRHLPHRRFRPRPTRRSR